jgi:hypothetical protein
MDKCRVCRDVAKLFMFVLAAAATAGLSLWAYSAAAHIVE